jgi:hypothetical protein
VLRSFSCWWREAISLQGDDEAEGDFSLRCGASELIGVIVKAYENVRRALEKEYMDVMRRQHHL